MTPTEAQERIEILKKRHAMAVKGGKAVCASCSRGHDMRSLVIWPCPDAKIILGQELNPKAHADLVLRITAAGTEIINARTGEIAAEG